MGVIKKALNVLSFNKSYISPLRTIDKISVIVAIKYSKFIKSGQLPKNFPCIYYGHVFKDQVSLSWLVSVVLRNIDQPAPVLGVIPFPLYNFKIDS